MSEVTYQFSITTDFNDNLKSSQLHTEIQNSGISNNLYRIDTDDDDVFIVFENSLSSGDLTILNNLVNNHTPEIVLSSYTTITPITSRTEDDNYREIGLVTYRPAVQGLINKLEVISKKHNKVDSYSIRLVDLKAGKLILEGTGFTNNDYDSILIGNPSNVPIIDSILSVQVYVNKSNKRSNNIVYIDSIKLFHGNV